MSFGVRSFQRALAARADAWSGKSRIQGGVSEAGGSPVVTWAYKDAFGIETTSVNDIQIIEYLILMGESQSILEGVFGCSENSISLMGF